MKIEHVSPTRAQDPHEVLRERFPTEVTCVFQSACYRRILQARTSRK